MKKRLISIFASLAIMMTMAVPAMAEDTTVTVTYPEVAVTNIGENPEMITVKFSEAITNNDATNNTVYATLAKDLTTINYAAVKKGAFHDVKAITVDEYTLKLDVSPLLSNAEYNLVIAGLPIAAGGSISYTATETFTTGIIANIEYDETKTIKNVAAGKTVTSSDSTLVANLGKWIDGDFTNSYNFTDTTNYAVIDLGAQYEIASVEAMLSGAAWGANAMGVWLTNDVSEAAIAGATWSRLQRALSGEFMVTQTYGSFGYDGMMDYVNFGENNTGKYQYVVIKNAQGSGNVNIREVAVFVEVGTSSVTTTVDFGSTQTAVTNVGTNELIEVTFSDAVKANTITNSTVYAQVQTTVETKAEPYVTAGDKHNVNIVDATANSFKIDVSSLKGFVEYKLVIDGVEDANGDIISYTSDTFKTGTIAQIAYDETKIIRNIAKNKTTTLYESTGATSVYTDAAKWTDGDYTNSFNLSHRDGAWPRAYVDHYVVIDLGTPRKIDSIAVQSAGAYNMNYTGIYLKNSLDGITIDTLKAETAKTLRGVTSNNSADCMIHYADGSGEEEYRYIVLRNTGSADLSIREVFVFAQTGAEAVTASANFTSTPTAVTNIGTSELIEVTFSGAVNMDTVNTNTVYAICNTDRNGANTGIAAGNKKDVTIINKGTNSFNIDVYNLDGLVDYTLVVDGVEDIDGVPVTKLEASFKTGAIARLPYQEGKIIKNVAEGKSISIPNITSNDGYDDYTNRMNGKLGYWLDGDVTTGSHINHLVDGYAVIDLGNKYKIETMGAIWAGGNWTNKFTQIYLTNDLSVIPETSVGFYWADRLQGCGDLVDYVADLKSVFNDEDGYRYIIVNCSNTGSGACVNIRELYAFGYEEANEMYIAKNITLRKEVVDGEEMSVVDKITLTAQALKTGDNTLILAEYNNGTLVRAIPQTCLQGAATIQLTPVDGYTYKAFLWNSVTGMTPVIESVEF